MQFLKRTIDNHSRFLRSVSSAEILALLFFVIGCLLFFPLDVYAATQNYSVVVPGSLIDQPLTVDATERTPDLIFGLFIGVMFTASLYMFFIWVVIHDRGQVFLILLLLCLGTNMASTNESMTQLLGLYNQGRLDLLQSYSMILAYFFGLIFTYHFLEIETNAAKMRPAIFGAASILLILLFVTTFFQGFVHVLLPIIGVICTIVILVSGLASLYAGASGGLSHITAFSAFLIGTMATPLYDLGLLSYPESAKNFTYLGFSIAAMMFAIVIAVQFSTRQEEKEKALEVSNERFSLAAKGSNEGLFDWRYKTEELYLSDQLRRILGLTSDTTPKKFRDWMKLISAPDRRLVLKALQKLRNAQGTSTLSFEIRFTKPTGEHCWIHTKMVAVKPYHTGPIERLVGSIGDVTQRKRGESELRASETRFRSITEAHPVPVLIARLKDGQIMYASPGAEILLGLPNGLLVSHTIDRFIARTAERDELIENITNHQNIDMKEILITRGDGDPLPAAVSARHISYRNESSMVVGIYDLTERKKAEVQIAQQQEALQQSEKMAALGGLLAGVAHELNNPLSVVMGQTTLLMEGEQEPKTKTRAEKIFKAADRCSRIVKSFLALARRKPPEHKNVNINEVINSSLELLSYQFRNECVDLTLDLAANLPSVIADIDQMTQVFTNLALNAAQAMHEWQGKHKITIRTKLLEETDIVQITFIDTGPGIPEELRKRVFEPFFTTKSGSGGTGVGLALCMNIISGHGGHLTLEDTPDGGATFTITLPASTAVDNETTEGRIAQHDSVKHLKILLVDDEVELAQTLADLLEPDGHDIDLAANGAIAIDKLRKTSFDVIISDLRMPVLDGPGLYAEMARSLPQYLNKIIYVTGDTLSTHVNAFLQETPVPVIEKPYRFADVQKAIVNLLKEKDTQSNIGHDSILPAPDQPHES
ncbi:MAG: ATP-binding protein [Alphaproteobacteria bacterium]|nr:ATP-binding protein [Alphaproteobacteria bacterium]